MAKLIGIVYAISESASEECVKLVKVLSGNKDSCVTFENPKTTEFFDAKKIKNIDERNQRIAEILYEGVLEVIKKNAKIIIVPANSVHVAFPILKRKVEQVYPEITLISIVDAVLKKTTSYSTLAIFGSSSTIESRLYHNAFSAEKEIIPLSMDEQKIVDAIIVGNYSKNNPLPGTLISDFTSIVSRIKNSGAQVLIFACTELPLLLNESVFLGLPTINSNKALAEYAVDFRDTFKNLT